MGLEPGSFSIAENGSRGGDDSKKFGIAEGYMSLHNLLVVNLFLLCRYISVEFFYIYRDRLVSNIVQYRSFS